MPSILELCRELPERRFAAGEILLEEGQKARVLYFMISGKVEILSQGISFASDSQPGSIFGEMSVLLDLPHTATVRALVDSRFYYADDPKEFLRAQPEIYTHISALLAQRLRSVTNHLVETQAHLKDKTEHALMHRVMEALRRSLATPPS